MPIRSIFSLQGKRDEEAAKEATARIERTLASMRAQGGRGHTEALPTWIVLDKDNVVGLHRHFPQQWHRLNALLHHMPYLWAHQSIDPHMHLDLLATVSEKTMTVFFGIKRDAYEGEGGGFHRREGQCDRQRRGTPCRRKCISVRYACRRTRQDTLLSPLGRALPPFSPVPLPSPACCAIKNKNESDLKFAIPLTPVRGLKRRLAPGHAKDCRKDPDRRQGMAGSPVSVGSPPI
jgi:hypothetical protein